MSDYSGAAGKARAALPVKTLERFARQVAIDHIKIGRGHGGTRVVMLVAGVRVRVVSEDGDSLRELDLDATRRYQAIGRS